MKKKTNFLGWDCTPRKELWSEIKRQETQLEIQEYNFACKQREVDRLREGLKNSEAERVEAYRECARLKNKLLKFERQRGRSGKFIPRKQDYDN